MFAFGQLRERYIQSDVWIEGTVIVVWSKISLLSTRARRLPGVSCLLSCTYGDGRKARYGITDEEHIQ